MVKKYISRLQFDHMIDDESAKYLKENSPKPGRFYTIPKIHKQGNPGRPIVRPVGRGGAMGAPAPPRRLLRSTFLLKK